ncbi:hypothetical protein AURDEDRAFT_160177 [Auricularia subglabra TFB-10046 SS5]|nr:hypothetical protein AURDEDRAFT_160177 [Auricularia subglabra TFB-10046 SS5]
MPRPPLVTTLAFHSHMLSELEGRARDLRAAQAEAHRALRAAQGAYDSITEDLDDIDTRILSLSGTVHDLDHHFPAHVLQAFPDELLRLVFGEIAARPHDRVCWDTPLNKWPRKLAWQPFQVAGVCRRWRRVALELSSLWSMVTFRLRTTTHAAKILPCLTCMLARSGNAPLDIFMDWSHLEWSTALGQIDSAIQKTSGRWRRYSFVLPDSLKDDSLFDNYRYPTPLLEEFSVQSMSHIQNEFHQGFPHYLVYCPRLQRLRANGCHVVRTKPLGGHVPLEYLSLTCELPSAVVWQILSLTQDTLVQLELEPADRYLDAWSNHLKLPALSSAIVEESSSLVLDNVLPLFKDTLTSLVYDLVDGVDEHYAEAVAELSNLRHLALDSFCEPSFFLYLAEHNSLPSLEILVVAFPTSRPNRTRVAAVAEALLQFVRARTAAAVDKPNESNEPRALPIVLRRVSFAASSIVPDWLVAQLQHLGVTDQDI